MKPNFPRLAARPFVVMALVVWTGGDRAALGQGRGELVSIAADSQDRIDALGRDVERAASLRQIKDLQILYTQYAQFGLWDEVGGLLSNDIELWSDDSMALKGNAAF